MTDNRAHTVTAAASLLTAMTLAASLLGATPTAGAQALMVLPVNIQMAPAQGAASLTIANQGKSETAVQVRVYAWDQVTGEDRLLPSTDVLTSPPMATLPPGGTQVVRVVLRKLPREQESTYRILIDQIPPPEVPGEVHVVLRLSIPIFAQPPIRTAAHMKFHLESDGGQTFLVASNAGGHHAAIRNLELRTADGREVSLAPGTTPYVLSGATRRWALTGKNSWSAEPLQLKAREDGGAINEQVSLRTP